MGGRGGQDGGFGNALYNLTVGEPIARARLLQGQVAMNRLQQAATRAGLFQDPATRAALFTDPAMQRLLGGQWQTGIPRGTATLQQFPMLSAADQPLLQYMTQLPGGLPPQVMTPELATMQGTLARTAQQELENQLTRQAMAGGIPEGLIPTGMRVGNVMYGLPPPPVQLPPEAQPEAPLIPPGWQPRAPAGVPAGAEDLSDLLGGIPSPTGAPRQLARLPAAPRRLGAAMPQAQSFIAGMVQRGWTPEEAAGTAGNIQAESGFDPGIQERRPIAGRGGFGLLQWTGPRRRALEKFAQATGRPLDDPEMQMDFLHAERTGASTQYGGPDERAGYERAFARGGSAEDIAERFGRHVERPANLAASLGQRLAATRQFYQRGPIGLPPEQLQQMQESILARRRAQLGEAAEGGRLIEIAAGAPPAPTEAVGPGERAGAVVGEQLAPAARGIMLAPAQPLPGAAPPPPPPPAMPPPAAAVPRRVPAAVSPRGEITGEVRRPPPAGGGPGAPWTRDLREAIGQDPAIREYLQQHGINSASMAANDPNVLAMMDEYAGRKRAAQQETDFRAKQRLEEEAARLPAAAYEKAAAFTDIRQRVSQLSQDFSPDEIRQYSGVLNQLRARGAGAAAAFGLADADPRFGQFMRAVQGIDDARLSAGLEKAEQDRLAAMVPMAADEPADFIGKARDLDKTLGKNLETLLEAHRVGPEARREILGRQPVVPPGGLFAPRRPPAEAPGAPPPAPAGPAPLPAPAAVPPPQGGVPAAEVAAGARPYDIALAERLGLAPLSAGETPEETAARRAQGLPRRPAELPGRPGEFATRLLRTISRASQPQYVGQTIKAGLGALGAPGAVAGAGTEALTGSRGLGTAAQIATDIAPAVVPAVRTIGRVAVPAIARRQLRTLSEEAVPQLATELGAKATQALTPVEGAGGVARWALKPEVASRVQQVGRVLEQAATATDPAQQATLLSRAASVIEKIPGSSVEDVGALRDLSKQILKQTRRIGRYETGARVARRVIGYGALTEGVRRALGPWASMLPGQPAYRER